MRRVLPTSRSWAERTVGPRRTATRQHRSTAPQDRRNHPSVSQRGARRSHRGHDGADTKVICVLMIALTLLVIFLVATLVRGIVGLRRRAFAVRRYEHAYSAIDAAVDRSRRAGEGPLLVPTSSGDAHVGVVTPQLRPRMVAPPAEDDGTAGV